MGLWNTLSGKTLRHKVGEVRYTRTRTCTMAVMSLYDAASHKGVFLELVFDQLTFVLITDF